MTTKSLDYRGPLGQEDEPITVQFTQRTDAFACDYWDAVVKAPSGEARFVTGIKFGDVKRVAERLVAKWQTEGMTDD